MKLVILGAGGFAREAYSWVIQSAPHYNHFTFYDQNGKKNDHIYSYPVINNLDHRWVHGQHFLVAVGDPGTRKALWEKAVAHGMIPCDPIVHPRAVTGLEVEVGRGSIICPGAVLTTKIRAGRGLLVNLNATIGHDCQLGDFVTLSPGANVSGNCTLGDRIYVGSNAVLREKIAIPSDTTIGMGAVVAKTITQVGTFVGNPARPLVPNPIN
jgi:sugar O-acyltransferase (sialic acid O-acetyltransferase NeuD family)